MQKESKRSARGIEPRTSCTQSRNHASRPSGHTYAYVQTFKLNTSFILIYVVDNEIIPDMVQVHIGAFCDRNTVLYERRMSMRYR